MSMMRLTPYDTSTCCVLGTRIQFSREWPPKSRARQRRNENPHSLDLVSEPASAIIRKVYEGLPRTTKAYLKLEKERIG